LSNNASSAATSLHFLLIHQILRRSRRPAEVAYKGRDLLVVNKGGCLMALRYHSQTVYLSNPFYIASFSIQPTGCNHRSVT
jgi:hypothetical protein